MTRLSVVLFFFNDTATTEIYTLSLHDALPISLAALRNPSKTISDTLGVRKRLPSETLFTACTRQPKRSDFKTRSEEHTSELQSQSNLVCRLLLEKKKQTLTKNRHAQAHATRPD